MTGLTKADKSYSLGFPAKANCYRGDGIQISIAYGIVPDGPIGIVFCCETRRCYPTLLPPNETAAPFTS